ncbi:MAG: hypothetical protein ACSLFF_05310 [Solirubrobacterales bacterium]
MRNQSRDALIEFVMTVLLAAPSTSGMAGPTQMAMAEIKALLIEDPSYLTASNSDAALAVERQLPATASQAVCSFATKWYFAGMTRGIAATIAAAERT